VGGERRAAKKTERLAGWRTKSWLARLMQLARHHKENGIINLSLNSKYPRFLCSIIWNIFSNHLLKFFTDLFYTSFAKWKIGVGSLPSSLPSGACPL
jgi:hypothetical protein